jgi:hypothetical protein
MEARLQAVYRKSTCRRDSSAKRSSLRLKQFRQSLRLTTGRFIVRKTTPATPVAGLPFLQALGEPGAKLPRIRSTARAANGGRA